MNNTEGLPVDTLIGDIHRVANVNKNGVAKEEANVTSSVNEKNAAKGVALVAEVKKESNISTKEISSTQLEKVAQQLQDFVGEMNKGLEFLVDQDSGRDVIKVIDKNSGDLIKQYPSEEVLNLVAKLSEATGNFINTDV
jgi:flagellar protein FlaG